VVFLVVGLWVFRPEIRSCRVPRATGRQRLILVGDGDLDGWKGARAGVRQVGRRHNESPSQQPGSASEHLSEFRWQLSNGSMDLLYPRTAPRATFCPAGTVLSLLK
jgi:hypothetical protein